MRNLLILLLLPFFGYSQTTYFFQSGDLNDVANWYSNSNGTGSNPSGFTTTTDIFDLNGKIPNSLATDFTIDGQLTNSSGTKSTITIGTGHTLTVSGRIPSSNNMEINISVANSKLILSHSSPSNIPEISGDGILEISGGGTKTATAPIEVKTLNINGTTSLDMKTYQLTKVSSVGTADPQEFPALRSAFTGGLPFPEGLNFPSNCEVALYAGGADQLIPGAGASYGYLTLTGSSTKTINSGSVTISGDGIEINHATALEVPSGTTLNVSGTRVTLSADAPQYAQLLVQGTFTANSNTEVWKEYDLNLSSARWFHMGIGVTGGNLDSLPAENGSLVSSSGNNGSIWFWNASNSKWTNPPSLKSNDPKIGYTIFAGNVGGIDFLRVGSGIVVAEGTGVATGTQNITLAYHDGSGGDLLFGGGVSEGWNLIANPYTASYDWNGQTLPSNTNNAVYVWDGTQYTSYVNGTGANGGTRYIAPGQAFWVQTTAAPGGTLDLDPSHLTVAEPTFLKTKLDYVHLQLKKASGQQLDEIAVGFNAAATNGFDGSFDAHKLPNSVGIPNLSADFGNQPLSISRAPSTTTDFPVRLESNGGPQNLMFTIDQTELGSFTTVHIEDLHTGTTVELSNGGSYSFVHTDMDIEDRFVLKFSGSTIGIEEEVLENQVSMSIVDNELFIFNHSDALSLDAVLLDIQGRIITTFETGIASPRTSILLPNLSSGVYIVRYKTNEGHHGLQRISKY